MKKVGALRVRVVAHPDAPPGAVLAIADGGQVTVGGETYAVGVDLARPESVDTTVTVTLVPDPGPPRKYRPEEWPRDLAADFEALRAEAVFNLARGVHPLSTVDAWLHKRDGFPRFPERELRGWESVDDVRYRLDRERHAKALHAALTLWFAPGEP